MDQANTASLRDAKPPTSKTELISFLGLCNVYRRFIENFAKHAHPLNQLLKKGSPDKFELTPEQVVSFKHFIDTICSSPVLALPKPDLPYSVDTDASAYGLGCALFQTHSDGSRKPIGFWSRSLNPAEKNYSASERECLAVVWALQTLRPYLIYEHTTVHTDHRALHWLMNISEPSGRLTRWRLRLSEFDITIQYRKGKDNQQADALSRLLTGSPTNETDDDDIPAFICEEEVDAGLPSTSTAHSDTPEKDLQECEPFEEDEYDQVDNLLATREQAPRELNFN